LTFKFDFSENSAADCVSETEQVMRDVIYEVMNQRYGINWETDERTGFSDFEIKALSRRTLSVALSIAEGSHREYINMQHHPYLLPPHQNHIP
jgi:hypothetical protein